MPYKMGIRRKMAKKRVKRVKRPSKRVGSMVRSQKRPFGNQGMLSWGPSFNQSGIFPKEMWVDMRYSETVQLSLASVTGLIGTEQYFLLNSLFDPNFSGVGHQPYRFDELTPMYGRYTVYAATVRVEIVHASITGLACTIVVKPSASSYTVANSDLNLVREKAGAVVLSASNYNDNGNPVWEQKIKIGDVWGVPGSVVMSDDVYGAVVSANPTNNTFLGIACGSWNGSVGQSIFVNVSIVYHARLSALKNTAFS